MAEDTVAIDLDADADKAWAVIGDFGGAEWFPGIEAVRVEGDVRILSMAGMEVREQLVSKDDQARVLVYAIVGGVPVERHQATVTVTPEARGSRVTWAVQVEPDSMLALMTDVYRQALEALRQRLS